MNIPNIFRSFTIRPFYKQSPAYFQHIPMFINPSSRAFSTDFSEDPELKEFMEYMDGLKNYEKSGVPKGAGTDSDDGFDLGRMKRLLQLLGNPQSQYKAIHIAGTKGKGSTAAFLSSILRAEGYSVGCYTSPHMQTIRERITLGRSGEPVSAKALNCHFQMVRADLERAVKLEKCRLSHFEVFTAVAFSVFAQEKVDVAVIEAGLGGARDATNVISSSELAVSIITTIGEEHLAALGGSLESIAVAKSGIIKDGRPVVLGGPFLPHIERILRDKASSMSSPVVSASDPGNRSILKGFSKTCQKPYQLCDILLRIERDLSLFIELLDVKLRILGPHQLQNATTATCAALCLRHKGWRLSDTSVRAGLESTFLLGRSQFLTSKEAEMVGLCGPTILLDGAHTKESARALTNTIKMTYPGARLVLVVAMASDKDHLCFARELLSGIKLIMALVHHPGGWGSPLHLCLENEEKSWKFGGCIFTEISIAGGKSRSTSASYLKDSWIQASRETNSDILDCGIVDSEFFKDKVTQSAAKMESETILFAEGSLVPLMRAGNEILREKSGEFGIIVVTGSLHIVSAVLGSLEG